MTISPYDKLPSGNPDTTPLEYIDIEPEQPKVMHEEPRKQRLPANTVPPVPSPQYSDLHLKNINGRYEYTLPFEEALLVPDTMPDMQKVLFVEGHAAFAVPGKSEYDRNDFLSGNITVYTVYSPINAVCSSIPFRTDRCWDAAEGDSFNVSLDIISIEAEMVNERKFLIRGELLIRMTGFSELDLKLFDASANSDIVVREDAAELTVFDCEKSDSLEISQDMTLRDNRPSPVKILESSIEIVETQRRLTSGKLIINGSIHSQILYLGENDVKTALSSLSNSTDFTQFIPMEEGADPDLMHVYFDGSDLGISIENKDKLLLEGTLTTFVRVCCSKRVSSVSDAYHKSGDLFFDKETCPVHSVITTVAGEVSSREVAELSTPGKRISSLLCGSCRYPVIEARHEKGRIVIDGSVPASIVALDDSGEPFVITRKLPVRGAVAAPDINDVDDKYKSISINVDADIKEFWFNEINSSQVEINLCLSLKILALGEGAFCTIENLRFAERSEASPKTSMAIYTVSGGDTLWDISKRYKTDVDSISAINDLDSNRPLCEGSKLLIVK